MLLLTANFSGVVRTKYSGSIQSNKQFMTPMKSNLQHDFRVQRTLLATSVASAFALSTPTAMAVTTWTVNTCTDAATGDVAAHSGSLRFSAANAVSDDVIDLTQLSCSVISLKSGAISLAQDSITLNGPGMNKLYITGKYAIGKFQQDRVISHTGTGTLAIDNLSIQYGHLYTGSMHGGCILSWGDVSLNHVTISNCKAGEGDINNATGGGIETKGSLLLRDSNLSDNAVDVASNIGAYGGGANVYGDLVAVSSTISNNFVGGASVGGGVRVRGNAYVGYSTITNNVAHDGGGGLENVTGDCNATTFSSSTIISSSTISGNSVSDGAAGGGLSLCGALTIINSTIAFNAGGGGIALRPYGPMPVTLLGSLIANNTINGGQQMDMFRCCGAAGSQVTFSGSHNIIRTPGTTIPAGLASTGVCPLLGPLRDNGGPTLTHALLSHSPGIDQSDSSALSFDQRGFDRISGVSADIGAYEVDQGDIIFNVDFEGCP